MVRTARGAGDFPQASTGVRDVLLRKNKWPFYGHLVGPVDDEGEELVRRYEIKLEQ